MNIPSERDAISQAVRRQAYDFVGFSLSCEALIEDLASAIRVVRSDSILSTTKVIVGGHAFEANPILRRSVGADLLATTAVHALELANSLVKPPKARR